MAEARREGNRGDVALIVLGGGLFAARDEMGAGAQPVFAIDGLSPDKRGRAGSVSAGRAAMTRPMKSFFGDISLPRPRSCAVVWPFSSLPAACPFSMRITPSASVP